MPVNAKATETAAARSLVARALSLSVDSIEPDTKMFQIPVWDSLGQLCIIIEIEEMLHVQIADESTFAALKSIRGIATYLAKYGL